MTKVVIDCDTGIDDALAIAIALRWPGVQVEAITCVGGNTGLDNVVRNTLSVTKTCNSQVPIFPGCRHSLLRQKHAAKDNESALGSNGFGAVNIELSDQDWQNVKKEHASVALCRLARENRKNLTLVALGPLTNIAIAMRLDPAFSENLKEIVVMGGNYLAPASELGGAEFNFFLDSEAADIVLREANCPIMVVPFDTCISSCPIPWSWFHELTSDDAKLLPQGRLMRNITSECSLSWPWFTPWDAVTMVAALDKTTITCADTHKQLAVNIDGNGKDGKGYGCMLHDNSGPGLMNSKLLFENVPTRTVAKAISTNEIKRRIEASLLL